MKTISDGGAKCLEMTFKLGLFENPYNTVANFKAARQAGEIAGKESMRKALVLLKNDDGTRAPLPLTAESGKKFFYDGVILRNSSALSVLDGFDVAQEDVLDLADANQADVQIIRVTSRHGAYNGLTGGVPISWDTDVYRYSRQLLRHSTWAENRANIVAYLSGTSYTGLLETITYESPAPLTFNPATRVSNALPSTVSNISSNESDSHGKMGTIANARAQGNKLYDAIKRKKDGSQLIVIIHAQRPFIFGSRYVDAVTEISSIKRYTVTSFNSGTYSGTNLYIIKDDDTLKSLADRVANGTMTKDGTPFGEVMYVDPVSVEAKFIVGEPSPQETIWLNILKCNELNPLAEIVWIDNPLDKIDGLVVDFGIDDAQLIACLFGKDGAADEEYAPSATLPFAIGMYDSDIENQWEDIPNDEKNKMFGSRRGLQNWARGQAENTNNDSWCWRNTIPSYDDIR